MIILFLVIQEFDSIIAAYQKIGPTNKTLKKNLDKLKYLQVSPE